MAKKGRKRNLKQSTEATESSKPCSVSSSSSKKPKTSPDPVAAVDEDVRFIGKPVPAEEARGKWPFRYESKACFHKITFFFSNCYIYLFLVIFTNF